MPNADCTIIRKYLSRHPDHKLGFIVFRLTYKDDAEWATFMDRLNTGTRDRLEKYGEGDMFSHIDWNVQDDPSMENLEPAQIRERFKRIIEQESGEQSPKQDWEAYPRHQACVVISQVEIDNVMRDINRTNDSLAERGIVTLMKVDEMDSIIVDLSSIFPRVYALLDVLGWQWICANEDAYSAV